MSETPSESNSGGLKQDDFRKLLQTPRHNSSASSFGNFKTPRTAIKPPPTPGRTSLDTDSSTSNPYLSGTPKRRTKIPSTPRDNGGFIKPSGSATKKAKKTAEDASAYRDRAEERRQGINPDYIDSERILDSLNSVVGPDMTPSSKLAYEQSKYLGGDEKHTHLVKGLDYALLAKRRQTTDESEVTDDDLEKLYIEKQEISEESDSKEAPRFMTGLGERIYKVAFSEKPATPSKTDLFIAGRMAYVFELADELGEYTNAFALPTTIIRSRNDLEEDNFGVQKDTASELVASKIGNLFAMRRLNPVQVPVKEVSPSSSPEPVEHQEAPLRPVAQSLEDDNIFSDVSSDYELDLEAESKKSEEINLNPPIKVGKKRLKVTFAIEEEEIQESSTYDLTEMVKQVAEQTSSSPPQGESPENYDNSPPRSLFKEPPNLNYSERVYLNTGKSEDDSGLMYGGSDSDEELPDKELEVMDEGTSKNKRKQLSRWDFDDEEEWARYKEHQVHMPKAAFQFGVKSSEGRSHNKKAHNAGDKLNREYQQLKSFMDNKFNQSEKKASKDRKNSPKRPKKY